MSEVTAATRVAAVQGGIRRLMSGRCNDQLFELLRRSFAIAGAPGRVSNSDRETLRDMLDHDEQLDREFWDGAMDDGNKNIQRNALFDTHLRRPEDLEDGRQDESIWTPAFVREIILLVRQDGDPPAPEPVRVVPPPRNSWKHPRTVRQPWSRRSKILAAVTALALLLGGGVGGLVWYLNRPAEPVAEVAGPPADTENPARGDEAPAPVPGQAVSAERKDDRKNDRKDDKEKPMPPAPPVPEKTDALKATEWYAGKKSRLGELKAGEKICALSLKDAALCFDPKRPVKENVVGLQAFLSIAKLQPTKESVELYVIARYAHATESPEKLWTKSDDLSVSPTVLWLKLGRDRTNPAEPRVADSAADKSWKATNQTILGMLDTDIPAFMAGPLPPPQK